MSSAFYFLLTYGCLRLPLGFRWVVQARMLSVLFALAGDGCADRLWARQLPKIPGAGGFYSRMSRSYSPLTSQGLALDIPSGYGSQERGVEEVRMAVLYAFSSRLTSSSEFINVAVSP